MQAVDKPAKLNIDLDKQVLIFTEPVRADGTIDYIAAFNKHYSKGVTRDNNAFRDLYLLSSHKNDDGSWAEEEEHLVAMGAALGLTLADLERGPKHVDWYDYAEGLGMDVDQAYDLQEQVRFGPFDSGGGKQLAAWLDSIESVLVMAGQAVDKPRYWAPMISRDSSGLLANVLLGQLVERRRLARSLEAWAYYTAVTGEHDKTVQAIRTLRRLASHTTQEPTLIANLVGLSIEAMTAETVKNLIALKVLSADALALIQAGWDTTPSRKRIVDSILEGERATSLDVFMQIMAGRSESEEVFGDSIEFDQFLTINDLEINRGLRQISFRYRQLARLMEIKNYAAKAALLAKYEVDLEENSDAIRKNLIIEFRGVKLPNPKRTFLNKKEFTDAVITMYADYMVSGFVSSSRSEMKINARMECTFAAIAIERFRIKHGKLPASLAALVPTYLDAVPMDPFSGEPMIYKVTEQGFRVYAVDVDLKDNGGIEDKNEDGQRDMVFDVVWIAAE